MQEVRDIVEKKKQLDCLNNTSFKLIANVYADISKNCGLPLDTGLNPDSLNQLIQSHLSKPKQFRKH